MTKTYKFAISVISVSLVVAVIFGVLTRSSYKHLDINNAVFSVEEALELATQNINEFSSQNILSELENEQAVFVVTVTKSENIYQCTKTTAIVDKVIKGDKAILNKSIVIYEPNFIYYYHEQQHYYLANTLNNVMQVNKQYLLFVDKMKYTNAYQATLNNTEYIVDIDLHLYSFPINNPINYIKADDVSTYRDVKSYDYFCYSEEQRSILEKITLDVLNAYL